MAAAGYNRVFLRAALAAAITFLAGVTALADGRDATYDGIVTDSAALPSGGTVRLTGSAGTYGSAEGLSAAVGVSWSIIPNLAFRVDGVMENGTMPIADKFAQASPVVALRWQPLSQERFGVNMTGTLRWKTVGFDPNSGELELAVSVGRKMGPVLLVAGLTGGHDTQAVAGTDLEGHAQADVTVISWANVGFEGRFRTGRDPVNFPLFGSAWDVVAGAHAVIKLGPVHVQALVGYGGGAGPNAQLLGLGQPSPCGMLNIAGDLT